MSRKQIEEDLSVFKAANPGWMTSENDKQIVASLLILLTTPVAEYVIDENYAKTTTVEDQNKMFTKMVEGQNEMIKKLVTNMAEGQDKMLEGQNKMFTKMLKELVTNMVEGQNEMVKELVTNMVEGQNEMVEELTKMVSNVEIQLQHVVDLVERKTALKHGSQATQGEYNRFFSFTNCPNECWFLQNSNTEFKNSAACVIQNHQSVMMQKHNNGLVSEIKDVQGDSRALLNELMNLYFSQPHNLEMVAERSYKCRVTNSDLESIIYSGNTDAVIKSKKLDIAILCWEIKNQKIDLNDGGEIAQLAAEVAGELEHMVSQFTIKPFRYAAVLTNGISFLFVMALIVDGVYRWKHSEIITDASIAAAMMEGSFFIAAEVLNLSTGIITTSIASLQLNDIDDNHNGNHTKDDETGNDTKSGLGDFSLSGISQTVKNAICGPSTTKTSKSNGKKKSCYSQDYRFAPLTLDNVDLFNRMRRGFSFLN